jgi:hypothetical protein
MKNVTRILTVAIALSALALASPALATNFWTDSFTYSDGGLVAVSGGNWTNHSGTGTDIQVVSGEALVNMLNAPDDNRAFPARSATDKTYACFRFMLPNPGGNPSLGYFAHFKDAGTFNFVSRVYVAPFSGAFTLGLSVGSFTGTPPLWPTALTYGQWYTVVTSYDAATGTAEMWIDPVNQASPKITHTDATKAGFLVQAYALREFSGNWIGHVDDLGVGTSFEDACFAPVPTKVSTWGQVKGIYR